MRTQTGRRDSLTRGSSLTTGSSSDSTIASVPDEVETRIVIRSMKSESLPPQSNRRMSVEINEYVVKMNNIMSDMEYEIVASGLFTTSLDEKKCQLEKARRLRNKVKEVKDAYDNLISRLNDARVKVSEIIESNDKSYRDHLSFKESCSQVAAWIRGVRDKVPSLSNGNLSDRLGMESSLAIFKQLRDENHSFGLEMLQNMKLSGHLAMETSSAEGKTLIQNNMDNLERDFSNMFAGIDKTINELSNSQLELKSFKLEYEEVNEWLQGMEEEIKHWRSEGCKGSNLLEKMENVETCERIMNHFTEFKETKIKKLGAKEFLLRSHLENYARSQLSIADSRFTVLVNLLSEVQSKVKSVAEQHTLFKEKYESATAYIRVSIEMLNALEENLPSKSKDDLESGQQFCKELLRRNQEEGQPLIYQALDAGAKALASTHPVEGRDMISKEIQDLKSDWDNFLSVVGHTSSKIETAIVKLQDQEVKLSKIMSGLEEYEKKLADILSRPADPISIPLDSNISRAKLRKLDNMLQEVLSFEVTIAHLDENHEIRIRFNDLTDDIKDALSDAHRIYDTLTEFNTSYISFVEWIRISEIDVMAMESSDVVTHRMTHLDQIISEGKRKLALCSHLSDVIQTASDSECDLVIQTAVQKCRDLFQELEVRITEINKKIESQAVQLKDFAGEFFKLESFLDGMDEVMKRFADNESDLISKRKKLEEFQQKYLIEIFETESQFTQLNLKAQTMILPLESSDASEVSLNRVLDLCDRYSKLVIKSREMIHSLEQKYQEHQQLNQLLLEANEFLESSNEKIDEYQDGIYSHNLEDLNLNVSTLKQLITCVTSSSDHKVPYIIELSQKVISCTHDSGIEMIGDSVNHIVRSYGNLLQELKDILQEYIDRISYLQDYLKTKKHVTTNESSEGEVSPDQGITSGTGTNDDDDNDNNDEELQFYPKWSYVLHACPPIGADAQTTQ